MRVATQLIFWLRYCLFCSGALLLGIALFTFGEAELWQFDHSRKLDRLLNATTEEANGPAPAEEANRPAASSLIGRIEIHRIGLSAMVLEGADARTLRLAVGHIPDSALPGQEGNVILAGHRDTFFRALREARQNDSIRLTTPTGTYDYVIESTKVVDPDETAALERSKRPVLTLVTCYPFHFIGSAPKRFVVRAGLAQ